MKPSLIPILLFIAAQILAIAVLLNLFLLRFEVF